MSQSGPLKVRAMPSGNGFPRLKKNLFVVGVSSGYFLVCIAIACLASGVGGCCGVRCAADSWILQEHISVQRAVPFLSAEVFRSFSVSKTVDEKHGGCWRGRLVLRGGAWDGESDDEHVISLTGGSRPARQETERRAAPSRERNVGGDVRGGRDGDGGRAAMKEVGDQCVSIIQSMGGVADLNRIVARCENPLNSWWWCMLCGVPVHAVQGRALAVNACIATGINGCRTHAYLHSSNLRFL
eukprot:436272-Rhodomonas_salina.5